MKVLIVNNMDPFVWGGAEELAAHLQRNLIAAGHESEVMRIPFQWEPPTRIVSQMMMVRGFELWNVDRVIALKFPAYLIRHPHKTLWLLHQYRQAYDLFDAAQTNLPVGPAGTLLRSVIRNADNEGFAESRKIFTNSEVTRQRLAHYNGFDSEVLLPPLNDQEMFGGGKDDGYIFAGGRVNSMKRQHLLLEAMAYAPKDAKLVIAGPPDHPKDAQKLQELMERLGLKDRVKLDLRFLSRAEYASYMNNALAAAYLPFDEDSFGYVTMEAAIAGKATMTLSDSGGILGLVKHDQTGWVAVPEVKALGDVIANIYANPHRTRELGESAKNYWDSLEITWPKTVEKLLI